LPRCPPASEHPRLPNATADCSTFFCWAKRFSSWHRAECGGDYEFIERVELSIAHHGPLEIAHANPPAIELDTCFDRTLAAGRSQIG